MTVVYSTSFRSEGFRHIPLGAHTHKYNMKEDRYEKITGQRPGEDFWIILAVSVITQIIGYYYLDRATGFILSLISLGIAFSVIETFNRIYYKTYYRKIS